MADPTTSTRFELAVLSAVILLGVAIRLAAPSQMSVEHFDEGVYSSSIWFGADEFFQYPNRHYFAPPLLPGLIETSMVIFGQRAGVMIPSLAAGCSSLVLIWWVARQWFGVVAGLATATLASLSDFHQLYTRAALTEALLLVWTVLAVYFLTQALSSRQPKAILLAGVATALAWWTKYNGWLPLAIGMAAVGCWLVRHPRHWRQAVPTVFPLLSVAVIAGVLWTPVPWDLYQHWGGYQAIANNHRQYLVGLAGWSDSFWCQVGNHRYFEGWLSCLAVGFAFGLGCLARLTGRHGSGTHLLALKETAVVAAVAVALVAAASLVGSSVLLGGLAVAGIISLAYRRAHGMLSDYRTMQTYVLGVWFVGLLIATPFYRPYPRLTLPWLVSAWLGAGVALAQLVDWSLRGIDDPARGRAPDRSVLISAVILTLSLAVLLVQGPRLTRQGIAAWASRNGFEPIARRIHRDAQRLAADDPSGRTGPAEIYIYGEPGLFFHLKLEGAKLMAIEQLDFKRQSPVPTFLVTGPHAHRSAAFARQWSEVSDWFSHVHTYPYRASGLVLVNHFRPSELRQMDETPIQHVRLYRLR